MKFCKLENCKVKDTYAREHCFYGYWEPQCWKGWLDAIIFVITYRFKREKR